MLVIWLILSVWASVPVEVTNPSAEIWADELIISLGTSVKSSYDVTPPPADELIIILPLPEVIVMLVPATTEPLNIFEPLVICVEPDTTPSGNKETTWADSDTNPLGSWPEPLNIPPGSWPLPLKIPLGNCPEPEITPSGNKETTCADCETIPSGNWPEPEIKPAGTSVKSLKEDTPVPVFEELMIILPLPEVIVVPPSPINNGLFCKRL